MSNGGVWASKGGWVQCFTMVCGPPSTERCRLMLERDPRTDKGGRSSVAHGAKTVASGGRWAKCTAQRAGCVGLMHERGAPCRAGRRQPSAQQLQWPFRANTDRNTGRTEEWLRLLCAIVL